MTGTAFWIFLLLISLSSVGLVVLFWNGYKARVAAGKLFLIPQAAIRRSQLTRSISAISFVLVLGAYFLLPLTQAIMIVVFLTADVVFLQDQSKSMAAEKPFGSLNRLERSDEIIFKILDAVPHLRVDLYGFTASVRSLVGFTTDYEDIKRTIGEVVTIEAVPRPGSDLCNALKGVLDVFDEEAKSKIVVFLSDGEKGPTSCSEINEDLLRYREAGIKIIAVGIGEKEGAHIPLYSQGKIVGSEERGIGGERRPVTTYLKEELLREAALKTRGIYVEEKDTGKAIAFIQDNLAREERELPNPNRKYGKYLLIFSLIPLFFALVKNW